MHGEIFQHLFLYGPAYMPFYMEPLLVVKVLIKPYGRVCITTLLKKYLLLSIVLA